MRLSKFAILMGLAASAWSGGARAAGDLLVAPTRVVLDGARGTEVILNNIDSVPATYRVSLELRRMDAQGNLDEITPENATPAEAQALNMITYAPRRVELAPNQPQSIRIGLRAPADLPDGEYRVHMLFRAIPDARPVTETEQVNNGLSIARRHNSRHHPQGCVEGDSGNWRYPPCPHRRPCGTCHVARTRRRALYLWAYPRAQAGEIGACL
jgi:P pilus assembly chaperone PapD